MKIEVDDLDDSIIGRSEAIVLSMTHWERRHPEKIDGRRRKRISYGSGTTPADVNQLLKQFFEARKIARSLSSGELPALPGVRR